MIGQKPSVKWSEGIVDWHLSEDSEKATLLVVGDILLDQSFLGTIEAGYGTEVVNHLFSNMRQIFKGADIVMGNLENPLSDRGAPIFKYGPNFRGSPKIAKALREVGFTVLGVANNHTRDFGDLAFLDTLSSLRNEGILPVGGGRDAHSALRPVIIRKNKMSIGILAFSYRQESTAGMRRPGTADLDDQKCYDSMKALSDEVDLAIAYLHLDGEFSSYPAPHRVKSARRFIDLGAGMVIGHHPHVAQGIEIYKGKLIVYSLGNFVFQTDRLKPLTSLGYALKADLTQEGPSSVAIVPYRISNSIMRGHALCQPTVLSGFEYQDFMAHLKSISHGLVNTNLVRLNWEQMAIKDAMAISKHILKGIVTGEPCSLWSSHMVSLRRSCPSFLKRFLSGKLLGDIRSLRASRHN